MPAPDLGRLPRRVDVVAGVVSTALAVGAVIALPVVNAVDPDGGEIVFSPPGSVSWWLLLVCVIAQGAIILWSGHEPRAALAAGALAAFIVSLALPGPTYGASGIAVLFLVFFGALRVPLKRLSLPLAIVGVLVAAGGIVNGIGAVNLAPVEAVAAAVTQSVGLTVLPLFVALIMRSRRDLRDSRLNEQRARTGQRDAEVQAAVARERTSMARELHDIAAHHLSGIALMAAVVDRQIDTAPTQAHVGVKQIRAQSTAVLDDLRRLVGLLREDDADEDRIVQTLSSVPELVARAQPNQPVELRILTGEVRELGAGIGPLAQLALYRTIQEALTNASTHAPGAPTVVEIDDRRDTDIAVVITNTAPTSMPERVSGAGGFGLIGMAERAELVRADLHYGAIEGGGWRVSITVPRESASAPAVSLPSDRAEMP